MVYLYYDNPEMLVQQLRCWDLYRDAFEDPPEVFLIDDGSPRTFAADIVRREKCKISIRVYRILEDIPWNFAGARNLGCYHAEGWIYMSDIDTLLFADDAKRLFEGLALDRNCFYMPRMLLLPEMSEGCLPKVNLLFHKRLFLAVGGYDEDYAGHYGREETDFYNRLIRLAPRIHRKSVNVRVMPPAIISDARSTTRSRDISRNAELYSEKERAGFPRPVNSLRFTWERVL